MAPNYGGGYGFKRPQMKRALAWLILGSENNYYKPGAVVTMENVTCIKSILTSDEGCQLFLYFLTFSHNSFFRKKSEA